MSIATCGHEVFEGVSCSLKLNKVEWSYGTYCVDCLKQYYQDGLLEDNEAKKLCIEIEKLQKENEQMREVLTSIAFFDEPLAVTYGYWATRTELKKLMQTLAFDTYIARECLAKLGER